MPCHCAPLESPWFLDSLCNGGSLGKADNVSTNAVTLLRSPENALLGKWFCFTTSYRCLGPTFPWIPKAASGLCQFILGHLAKHRGKKTADVPALHDLRPSVCSGSKSNLQKDKFSCIYALYD